MSWDSPSACGKATRKRPGCTFPTRASPAPTAPATACTCTRQTWPPMPNCAALSPPTAGPRRNTSPTNSAPSPAPIISGKTSAKPAGPWTAGMPMWTGTATCADPTLSRPAKPPRPRCWAGRCRPRCGTSPASPMCAATISTPNPCCAPWASKRRNRPCTTAAWWPGARCWKSWFRTPTACARPMAAAFPA